MSPPCGYFRVSKEDTALDKFAVKKYQQKLRDYGVDEKFIFYDFSSGGDINRDGYREILRLIQTKKCDRVVVPMQSRLNRNLLNSELLAEDLASVGAKIVVLETGATLDPNCPTDRLLYQIRAIFDANQLADYKKTSQDNAREMRRLRKLNRVPFGYVLYRGRPKPDRDGYLCLLADKKEFSPADVLLHLIDLVIEHRNLTKACRLLLEYYGVPQYIDGQVRTHARKSKQFDFSKDPICKHRQPLYFTQHSAKKLMTHKLLVGDLEYFARDKNKQTIYIPNAYPECAIISRSKFDRLQASMENREFKRINQHHYPYTGLVYCGVCGGKFYSDRGGKRVDGVQRILYYFCKNRAKGCRCPRIKAEEIESATIARLVKECDRITGIALEPETTTPNPEILKLQQQIKQLQSLPIIDDLIRKSIDETRKKIDSIRQEELLGVETKQENVELLKSVFSDPLYWETLPQLDKREILHLLVKKIEVGLDGICRIALKV